MVHIFGVLLAFGMVFACAFHQLSIRVWTIFLAIGFILLLISGLLSPIAFLFFAVFYAIAALFANLSKLRQRYITAPALSKLQRQIPTISKTEREALTAGHTWWEKELFIGRPNWKNFLTMPRPMLNVEEQHFLDNQVETVCSMICDWDIINRDKDLPKVVWDYLKKEKFFGLVIPKEYGGLGFSALAHSTIIVKMATRSISAAVNTMVPNSLGPAELLLHYGTDEQKSYYLPRLAAGLDVPCFALTAPEAGSDAGSIPDTGIVCYGEYNGAKTLGIRLSWDKRYITLAPIATVLGLAFQLYDPDHLIGDKNHIGITLCLIPTQHPGVEIGSRHYPMQLTFMNGPTRGHNVFIPLEWIIGGVAMAGQGWRMLMECLSIGRSISLPALSTACGKMTYRYTGAYARIRKQFNTSISNFEGIEEALGYIAGNSYLLEATRIMTAGAIDQKVKPSIASAIAKYHMTEMSRAVISHAMDVHAGQAIQLGPRNFLAYAHFAIPISITVEGANILTRNLIIFGQGAIRCHPYLLKEIELLTANNPKIEEIDSVLLSHLGFFVGNLLRNFAYSLTGGRFIFSSVKNKKIRKYQKQLTRMSAALALLSDTSLLLLGGSLKRRERISARLGDIMSQLYLASAALKYYYDHDQPQSDVDHVCWALQQSLYKIQIAIQEICYNFPYRVIGWLLNKLLFPFGLSYLSPSDSLHKNIVKNMLHPNTLRDRITKYFYYSRDEMDLGNRLERAFDQLSNVESISKKIQTAIKNGDISSHLHFDDRLKIALTKNVINENEAAQLSQFEKLREEIIKVNEFSFDLNQVIS
jgi:acyl-CoA dehydrogenase